MSFARGHGLEETAPPLDPQSATMLDPAAIRFLPLTVLHLAQHGQGGVLPVDRAKVHVTSVSQ